MSLVQNAGVWWLVAIGIGTLISVIPSPRGWWKK